MVALIWSSDYHLPNSLLGKKRVSSYFANCEMLYKEIYYLGERGNDLGI
jgi:hypothetical protein